MAEDSKHHIIPLATYLNVFAALIVLTVLTVLVAQVDFGALNTIVAFGIATFKAVLVLAYFMHLKYDDRLFTVIFIAGVFFLILLWFFCVLDEGTRVLERSTL